MPKNSIMDITKTELYKEWCRNNERLQKRSYTVSESKEAQHLRIERAKRDQYLDDNLKTINRKLDEHNGYAAKFADISADIRVLRTEVEHIKEK